MELFFLKIQTIHVNFIWFVIFLFFAAKLIYNRYRDFIQNNKMIYKHIEDKINEFMQFTDANSRVTLKEIVRAKVKQST